MLLVTAALRSRYGHYIFALWFLLLLSFFSSSPNLSGRRVDVYHTSTHRVALARIQNAGLKCVARGSLEIQDAKMSQKSPSGHHHTNLSGCIFVIKTFVDNREQTC